MSLIKCSECKKKISNKARICPHCGNNIRKEIIFNKIKNNGFYIAIVGIIIFLMILILLNSKSNNNSSNNSNSNSNNSYELSTSIKTTSSSNTNYIEKKEYDGVVYDLNKLRSSKKTADLFVNAINKYMTNLEYSSEYLLKYVKKTNENGYIFYNFESKMGVSLDLIFNKNSKKFHCITIFLNQDSPLKTIGFLKIKKAAMYVAGVYDDCVINYSCRSAIDSVINIKTNYDIYEVESYVPDYTGPSFFFMSTEN